MKRSKASETMREVIENKWMQQVIVHGGEPLSLKERVAALEAKLDKTKELPDLSSYISPHYVFVPNVCLPVIQSAVARACRLSMEQMLSPGRDGGRFWGRFIGYWLSRELTGASRRQIALAYNQVDHGTVQYGELRVRDRMETEPAFRQKMEDLKLQLANFLKAEVKA